MPAQCAAIALLDSPGVPPMRPSPPGQGEVTTLLRAWSDGDADAFERVLPLVYDELHRMAARYLAGERSTISLQATAWSTSCACACSDGDPVTLAEPRALLRRLGPDDAAGARGHRAATTRRAARRRRTRFACRSTGSTSRRASRAPTCWPSTRRSRCSPVEDPRKAQVVELRFFGGLSIEETAQALGVSARTVHADWAFARAWLYRTLSAADAH